MRGCTASAEPTHMRLPLARSRMDSAAPISDRALPKLFRKKKRRVSIFTRLVRRLYKTSGT